MPRHINLRQIEAFKAMIESGTVSRAADLMSISQPGMSKLIAHLELDTGLRLFDRSKGRLAPTRHAMRLYQEIDHIFAGVRQVESAVDVIRREEQGQLSIGVMPALSAAFIERVVVNMLATNPELYCSVQSLGSQWVVDRVNTRRLDVGLIDAGIENPYLTIEPIMAHPLVCIMPLGHPLASKRLIKPKDLDRAPFVMMNTDTYLGHEIAKMFDSHDVQPKTVLTVNVLQTLCGLVAGGLGVSLVHPLVISGFEHRLLVRRFEPEMLHNFVLCRSADNSNAQLVEEFAEVVRKTAATASASMLASS